MAGPSSLVMKIPPPDESTGRIFVVDDDEQVRGLLRRLLVRAGYVVEEFGVAETAAEALRQRAPDLVLLDLNLPGESGNDFLEAIRDSPATRLLPVVMLTGAGTREDRLRAQRAGVTDFLTKPIGSDELLPRVRSLVMLKHFADEHEHAERVILMLAKTIDARDSYTAGHSGRVAQYSAGMASKLGLKPAEVAEIRRGALFHDIGKIVISDSVLKKVGPLSPEERALINRHPAVGCELLSGMKTMRRLLPIVYHHHEHLDGSGYPDGISASDISLPVRIVSVADVFDAVTTKRTYRSSMSVEEAYECLDGDVRQGWWDPEAVKVLKAVVGESGLSLTEMEPPSSSEAFST